MRCLHRTSAEGRDKDGRSYIIHVVGPPVAVHVPWIAELDDSCAYRAAQGTDVRS